MAAEPPTPLAGTTSVTLSHRHAFGLKADIRGSVHYAEETQLIYPVGTNTVLWQADQKQQKFFPANEGADGITCIAVNSTKRFLAVAEKCSEGAIATIYDLCSSTAKQRKMLQLSDCDCPEFVSVAFSMDSKPLLLTLTGLSPSGGQDWTLTFWKWDKAMPQGSIQVSNPQRSPCYECSFSPTESFNVATVVGDGIIKFFRLQGQGDVKQVPMQPPKLQNFLCHCWLTTDKLLVCCESGELLLFDTNGEFQLTLPVSPGESRCATSVVSFSKGFIIGGDDGFIRIFEKSEDPREVYRQSMQVQVDPGSGAMVRSLALSPSEEVLAISTSTSQLYQMSFLGQDLLKPDESPALEPVLTPFHIGPISGMDVCTRKPLVVTCGLDKSVRVWNYLEKTCELCKFFNEEAYSVAFHPSGFHLIIGFSDKLRLMNLLMEDMKPYRDIAIKGCRECRFSNGGQYFAAVSSNCIEVYKTYTCELIEKLRGHTMKVRSVAWTADDSTLVSTGMEGAVYEYNILAEGRRSPYDFVQKGTAFSCVIVHTDPASNGNTMYVVGSDRCLREVCVGSLTDTVEAGAVLGQIVLSHSAKTLFAAVSEPEMPGPIRCYKFPLDRSYKESSAHAGPATRIRITFDDQYLLSCGEDGSLFVFDVRKKDRGAIKREKESMLQVADEILVTRTFLDEKQVQLQELERQVEEFQNQIDFHLRHRESCHKEEMVRLEENYTQEIESERTKYELVREEKSDAQMEAEDNIKNLLELQGKQTQELESSFQERMMEELGRYQKLSAERDAEHKCWEREHQQLMETHSRKIQEMKRDFEEKQSADEQVKKRIMDSKELAERVHLEMRQQLEQDNDNEIEGLKEEKEAKLKAESDDKTRLRGTSGIHKNQHEELRRNMQAKEEELRQYREEARKKQERIDSLEQEKKHNQKEISDRDVTIGNKESRIFDLKKQNQELEKFKFVLDYKIRELKLQIDPKNDQIAEMKKQIQAMDADLEDYHRKNKLLQVNIEQLTTKQRHLQEEIVSQRKKMTDCQTIIKRLKTDLQECVNFIQEPKQLRESITNLYKKYVPNGIKKQELDPDIQREYNRQRDYLEKSVESLKRKLLKDSEVHRQDNTRVLQENVALIREINELQAQIDALKRERQLQRLNVSKITTRKPSESPKQRRPDLSASLSEIDANRTQIDDLRRRIDQQMALRQTALPMQQSG